MEEVDSISEPIRNLQRGTNASETPINYTNNKSESSNERSSEISGESSGESSGERSDESSDESSGEMDNSNETHVRKAQKTEKNTLMNKYEFLKNKMRNENSEAHKGEATSLVLEHLKELQEIYVLVRKEHNRDTKVHLKDAEAFMDTSKFAATNAKNLKFDDMGISLNQKDFITRLKGYLNADENNLDEVEYADDDVNGVDTKEDTFNSYNWLKLGALFYSVSNKAVVSDSLYGPMETERRRQTGRVRNVDDTQNGSLTTAQLVHASDISGNEEQNTAHMVKNVYKTFMQKREDSGVNFFKFFINPQSFAQSIENLFFTSFLIKDGRLKLFLNDEGVPIIEAVNPQEYEAAQSKPTNRDSNHHIATFDYKTWEGLVRTFNITESYLGHRPEPDDTFSSDDDNEA